MKRGPDLKVRRLRPLSGIKCYYLLFKQCYNLVFAKCLIKYYGFDWKMLRKLIKPIRNVSIGSQEVITNAIIQMTMNLLHNQSHSSLEPSSDRNPQVFSFHTIIVFHLTASGVCQLSVIRHSVRPVMIISYQPINYWEIQSISVINRTFNNNFYEYKPIVSDFHW